MNCLKSLCVIAFALANVKAVEARQAEIKSFHSPGNDFMMIEPGYDQKQPDGYDTVEASAEPVQLDRGFASLTTPIALQPSAPRALDSMYIPAWMRSSKPRFAHLNLGRVPSASLADCDAGRYAPHPVLSSEQELRRRRYYEQMASAACAARVPIDLFDALIIQESRYNPAALSSKGASGMTQLMPATARALGVFNRWDVTQNLEGGARYLRKQLDTFENWALALGAYNAGPGNVTKYGGLPPFRETRGYVRTILSSVKSYQLSQAQSSNRELERRRAVMLAAFTQ